MKKAVLYTVLLLATASCAELQKAKEVADSPQAQDVLDARDAICRVAQKLNPADAQVAAVQKMCAGDATLKEIAAKYAGEEVCSSEPALPVPQYPEASATPAAASAAPPLPSVSSGL